MPLDVFSHKQAVELGQTTWQRLRRRGLRSLSVPFQTIDMSPCWSQTLHEMVTMALPVSEQTRAHLRRTHVPLLLGISLGPDHREQQLHREIAKYSVTLDTPSTRTHGGDFVEGMYWTDEVITGHATTLAVQAIKKQHPRTMRERHIRHFATTAFAKTDRTFPDRVKAFDMLLQDPAIRTPILDAWFRGDYRRAEGLIRKYTGFDLAAFTTRLGRSGSYHEQTPEKPQNFFQSKGGYLGGTGLIDVRVPIAWLLPVSLGVDVSFIKTEPQNILTHAGTFLFSYIFGLMTSNVLSFTTTAFIHESVHAGAEGDTHIGYFPIHWGRSKKTYSSR